MGPQYYYPKNAKKKNLCLYRQHTIDDIIPKIKDQPFLPKDPKLRQVHHQRRNTVREFSSSRKNLSPVMPSRAAIQT